MKALSQLCIQAFDYQNEIEIWSAERATSENAFLSPKHRLASGK